MLIIISSISSHQTQNIWHSNNINLVKFQRIIFTQIYKIWSHQSYRTGRSHEYTVIPLFRGHLWSGDTSLQGIVWSGDTSRCITRTNSSLVLYSDINHDLSRPYLVPLFHRLLTFVLGYFGLSSRILRFLLPRLTSLQPIKTQHFNEGSQSKHTISIKVANQNTAIQWN